MIIKLIAFSLHFQTSKNYLIFFSVILDESRREVYEQHDSSNPSLRRESAELYTREKIPSLSIIKVCYC